MKIKKTEFPEKSILSPEKKDFNYIDSFEGEFADGGRNIDISEVGRAFFTSGPKWGKKMFAFRNKAVGIFGLKTGSEAETRQKEKDFKCEVGERVGLFKVFDKTSNEIVLGEDDKHLDFRVSLLVEKSKVHSDENSLTISTTVKYHNWLGVLYFLPVRPFHKLIVPAMLKNMIRQLQKKKLRTV
ncbi:MULTISPECIES: DUF2867 domain-containing protein [unclassified Chryseobacterium]|uniref:DUF2867 domain-containing protein n=1 Tax=unclassified Chryseobacterium TaxID=2593645 RepID=UPI000E0BF0C6|nr:MULTISPECIES: DUF2867 domain-containing protein [unclassified Chryseobacterium]MDQ1856103.1 DUF2867 domain-containing protein [Chryseobacterium sp. WLY505]